MGVDTKIVGDVVVVVPGIMGSSLLGPGDEPLWDVRPGTLPAAVRALGSGRLTLPDEFGNGPAPDGVRPGRLLDSLHVVPGLWSPVTGYDTLMQFLRSPRFQFIEHDAAEPDRLPNLIEFPYDWRLSCRHNGKRLAETALTALERWKTQPGFDDAKLVLVCHSMGGLVARWFAECEEGAPHIRAMVTLGTPYRGAARALGALVNGIESPLGLLRAPLTALARSLPSLHELLPQYACVVDAHGQRQRLDPATCKGVQDTLWKSACAFHARIAGPAASPYALHKVVGIRQPTLTTASWQHGRLVFAETIDGQDDGGDGTVPRLAAEPEAGRGSDVVGTAEQHGELQGRRIVWDLLDDVLTRRSVVWQAAPAAAELGIRMADVWSTGESPSLQLDPVPDELVTVEVLDEGGRVQRPARAVPASGRLVLDPLPEGAWRLRARGRFDKPAPVHKPFLVMEAP